MGNQVRPELLRLYKFGMVMFALQALYISVALYYAYLLEIQFIAVVGSKQYMSIDWAKLFFFPLSSWFPYFSYL
jgi:energy-converting hydrogenase Eha subunit C